MVTTLSTNIDVVHTFCFGLGDFLGIALANFNLSRWAPLGKTVVAGKSSKFVDRGR